MIVMIQPTLQRPPGLLPGLACGRSRRENCTLLPSSYCMSCPYASPAKDPEGESSARGVVLSRFRLTCHCWLHTHVRRRVRHGQAGLHTHARARHGHTLRGHTCVRVVRAMQATTGIRMCNRFQCGAQALRSVVQCNEYCTPTLLLVVVLPHVLRRAFCM